MSSVFSINQRLGQELSERDARRSRRKTFELVALLDFCDGEQPRPCELLDISDGGARLFVLTGTKAVPDKFNLILSPTANVQRSCRVVWRLDSQLGVRFLKSPV